MKALALLLLAVICTAEPIKSTKIEADDLKDSNAFVSQIQGDNDNMYVIVFEINEDDYTEDIQKALDSAKDDEKLSTMDIYQDDFDNSWEILFGQIDARDEKNYSEALHIIGADDPDFAMTYPIYLITKKGKGVMGSLTQVVNSQGKMTQAFRDKFMKVSGAQKAKAKPAADNADAPADPDAAPQ